MPTVSAGYLRPHIAVPLDGPCLRSAAAFLLCTAMADLRRHPELPDLYKAGVRYQREHGGRDNWQLPSVTASQGYGDCEDLASWRAAELRVRKGIKANVKFVQSGEHLWHAVVELPGGRIEDPSAKLGMRGRA